MSTHSTEPNPRDESHSHDLIHLEDLPSEIRRHYSTGTVFSPVYDGERVVLQEVKVT